MEEEGGEYQGLVVSLADLLDLHLLLGDLLAELVLLLGLLLQLHPVLAHEVLDAAVVVLRHLLGLLRELLPHRFLGLLQLRRQGVDLNVKKKNMRVRVSVQMG